jgi:hypothetical protein
MQPWQEEALPYLDKLLDPRGNRQTGRTYLLAVALIRAGCRNPGVRIPFIDHHDNTQEARHIVHRYVGILAWNDAALRDAYQATDRCFVMNLPAPVEDWRPAPAGPQDPALTAWERILTD